MSDVLIQELEALFWESANSGVLQVQRCGDCGKPRYFPERLCPFCLEEGGDWEQLSGRGSIYSLTVVSRAPTKRLAEDGPYVIALIDLDEGVRVMARLSSCPDRDPVVTDRVEFANTADTGDGPYLVFALADTTP